MHRRACILLVLLDVFCCGHGFSKELSLDPSARPAIDAFESILSEGKSLRKLGRLADAVRSFQKAAEQADRSGQFSHEAEALVAKTGCEIRLFRYADAWRSTQAARNLALRVKDVTYSGAADTNLATIYSQLGDFSAARIAALESIELLVQSPRKDYYIRALATKGDIEYGLRQVRSGNESFRKAIEVAKNAKFPAYEALASDHLATWLILEGDLPQAESALLYAQRIYEDQKDSDALAGLYEHLAELEWRKGGVFLKPALSHINLAFATKSEAFKTSPQYYPIHIKGQILLSLGQKNNALSEFQRAVESADIWRQSALPGDTTNTRTVAQLDSVYKDYAQLAAALALERDDHALVREAFEVLSRNRAASLREQLTRSYTSKLLDSPEYFDLLQQLQRAQASTTLENDSHQEEAQRQQLNQIRAKFSDLENHIGLNQQNILAPAEKKGSRDSLKGIQARLTRSEALLSFSLGKQRSFLWAVTSSDVRLYELPNQETIAHQAEAFSHAVSTDSAGKSDAGRALSRSLFANIAPSLKAKKDWLLTPDGALLDKVPFSALPAVFEGSDKPLIASHTIRLVPSASLLSTLSRPATSHGFVGVADPIYNLADSRRDRTAASSGPANGARPKKSSTVLGRLVASEIEIQLSAQQCGLAQTRMLTGKDASSLYLRRVTQQSPEILHFAVHVISPKDFPQEAALALSLTKDNLPELLTAESAATFHVSGSLVVLSGCASQQGEVLPGAGLVGLSRGWLLAGAAAVAVSAWPTPDASGSFFPTFYSHYRKASGSVGRRAALALQQTQLDMQSEAGYQKESSFWAAYSIISKE